MNRSGLIVVALSVVVPDISHAEIKLLATAVIPGHSIDKSVVPDKNGKLSNGTPQNRLGAFGSAIAWTGRGNSYVLLPDRGPLDGASDYQCRFHLADITLNGDRLDFELKETHILRNEKGEPFVGSLGDFARRLDPEGVRVSAQGTLYISEEYGPKLLEFSRDGKLLRRLPVPEHFLVAKPNADPFKEAADNTKGRFPNRGLESLALTPDGKKLVTVLQSALIQDGGRDGIYSRILELDIATEKMRELVYPLKNAKHGVNEILAVSERVFLVLERDSNKGPTRSCKIHRIHLGAASDVSGIASLPLQGLPSGTSAVTKTLLLDLAAVVADLPEKIEGLTFGPDLPGGRKLLLVTTDNDFTDAPSYIYGFSIDPTDLHP